ncbi:hypothetical protein N431DRAFT_496517 [Stipitochalara longipes BDJ]|nr:hypothetical protein N431DRAFT_496517 [Stipitochalara longipes BDJ]
MDDYLCEANISGCKVAEEAITYLEIFSYSDPSLNTIEEHPLPTDQFRNLLHKKGGFAVTALPEGVVLIDNVNHPEALPPYVISLSRGDYMEMIEAFHLSDKAIQSTNDENPHLHIIQRQSFPRRKGYTRGWEVMLSYEFHTGLVTGFCKGTPSSNLAECIKHLKACAPHVGHPLLLPLIIHSMSALSRADFKQRKARDLLRNSENSLAIRSEEVRTNGSTEFKALDLDMLNTDLVQCKAQILRKQYVSWLRIAKSLEKATHAFWEGLPEVAKNTKMKKLHVSKNSQLDFYKEKWQGVETYANTILQRLDIQKKKIAAESKRDSEAMKTLSLLGSIFFPGTFLASIFSTTFFNFQTASSISSAVSPTFWLYWAVTVPVTLVVVGMWLVWEKRKQKANEVEDNESEKGPEDIEKAIMTAMRKRTQTAEDINSENKLQRWATR